MNRATMGSKLTRREIVKGAAAGAVGAAALGVSRPRRIYAKQEQVTLTWWDYYSEGANNTAMDNQHQRYMESHPNVKIERTAIPFADLKTKLLQGATAGELPDIAVIDNPDHQAFAALGILEDLTERVDRLGSGRFVLRGTMGLDDLAGQELRHPRQQQLPRALVQHGLHDPGGGGGADDLGRADRRRCSS